MMMTKMVTKMATTLGYNNDDDGIWNMMMEYGNKEMKDIIAMPRAGESESVVGEGREWSSGFRSTHIADQIRIGTSGFYHISCVQNARCTYIVQVSLGLQDVIRFQAYKMYAVHTAFRF